MIGVTFKPVTQTFLVVEKVTDPLEKAKRRRLRGFAEDVIKRVRNSINITPRVSRPGDPPNSRRGTYPRSIVAKVDDKTDTVSIGPAKLSGGDARIPSLLEHGGVVVRQRRGRPVRYNYRARPHMAPAFAKEIAKEPGRWANQVK